MKPMEFIMINGSMSNNKMGELLYFENVFVHIEGMQFEGNHNFGTFMASHLIHIEYTSNLLMYYFLESQDDLLFYDSTFPLNRIGTLIVSSNFSNNSANGIFA